MGRLSICVAVFAISMAVAVSSARAEKIVLRLADGMPTGHIIDRLVVEPFIKEVEKATDGAVEIQHFPAEQLGKSRDMLMLTRSGVADIGFIVPSYMSDRMPLTAVTELPGIFQTTCQGNAALRELTKTGSILDEQEFKSNGIRPLIIFLLPAYQLILSSSHRLNDLKDIEGLKIRTPGGAMDLTVLGMGAVPIRVAPPEIYESMSRGTLDGALLAYQSAVSYHLLPLIKSGTTGQDFGTVTVTFSIGIKRWEALPPQVQKTLADIGRTISEQACGPFDKAESESIEKMRAAGVRLLSPHDSDRAALDAAFDKVRVDWARKLDNRGKPGSVILSAFMAAAAVAPSEPSGEQR
jgi:TRAP-type C4-dicarboxylate transport system substrate-binding protein